MIRGPHPIALLSLAVVALVAFTAAPGPAGTAAADMLSAPLCIADLDLSGWVQSDVATSSRPRAEQGRILYAHRMSRAVLDDETIEQALGSLDPGTPVRLGLPGGNRALQGDFAWLDRDAVHVETWSGPARLDRAGIRRVWVGRPQTAKGALIGAIHGFGLGMMMGARWSSDFETDRGYAGGASRASQRSDLEEIGQLTFHWGLPVAMIGAALGAVIGSGVTGWQPATP